MSEGFVRQRLNVSSPDGVISPSGVLAFRNRFQTPESVEQFFDWANSPVTSLMRNALRDLALNGPAGMSNSPTDPLVQYGMTLGLSLAAQMVSDPSIVFPDMFRGRQSPVQAPEVTFDTDPENL